MTETAAPTSFVVIPRTKEHGGYEYKCFTHYVQETAAATACEDRWFSRTRNGSRTR